MYEQHLSKFDLMRLLEDDSETRQKVASISPSAGMTYADLSDIDKASVKVDKRKPVYDSATGKWVGKDDKLSELDDVNVVGLENDNILSYDQNNEKWTCKSGKLEDICNFDKTDLQDGDFIKYDEANAKWVPTGSTTTIRHLSDIGNVESDLESTCADGDSIKWDDTNSRWVRAEYSEPIKKLANLEDVHINTATLGSGSVLSYSTATNKWENHIIPTINKYRRILRVSTKEYVTGGTSTSPRFHFTLEYISDRDILYTSNKYQLETIFNDIWSNKLYNRNMLNKGLIRNETGIDIPIVGAWTSECDTTKEILYGGASHEWLMSTNGISFRFLPTSSVSTSSTQLKEMTIDAGEQMLSLNLEIEDQLIENISVPIFGEVTIGKLLQSTSSSPNTITFDIDIITPPVAGSSLNVQIRGGYLACGSVLVYIYELDPNITYDGSTAHLTFNKTSVTTSSRNNPYVTINFNSNV